MSEYELDDDATAAAETAVQLDREPSEDARLLEAEPASSPPNADALNSQSLSKLELTRLLALARPQAGRLTVALVSLLLASASFLVVPAMMGAVIDAVMNPTSARWSLVQAVIALFVVFLLSSVFTFVRTVLFTTAGERIVTDLRQDVFSSILKQEIGFFDVNKTGELMNRLSSDCTVLQQTVTVNLSMGLRWGIQAIGGFFVLFFISWKLTLVMFTIFPLIAIASWIYGKYVRSLSKEVQERLADASSVAEETLSSIRTVRAFAGEYKEIQRYVEKTGMSFDAAQKRAYAEGTFAATATLIANAAIAAVLWYGGSLVLSGEISVGTLTSFILYTLTVAVSFGGLSTLYGDLMKAIGASERVFYLVDRTPQVPFSGGRPVVRSELEGSIEFKNAYFSYPSRPEHIVLQDFNLNLPCGQVVALVGHSGGGKSTVAHLIEGFYRPARGSILLDGIDLAQFEPRQLRRAIGIVTQEPTLFGCSIAENISYGAEPRDFPTPAALRQAVVAAAKLAHAHEFICDFPQQYDTLVGERGVRLSGGQKQRIAIARALLIDPKILLLDEATSALDAESEYLVKSALDTLIRTSAHRRTVLVIAHRLSTVKNADRVAVIKSGHVVEEGSHEQLLERNGEYKKLVSRQLLAQD